MSYTGKYLEINLSNHSFEIKDTNPKLNRKFIGGKGLGFALLDKLAPNPDPLGPENPIIFVNGPFTGSKVQTSARSTLVTKSPLTNSILDTHVGGSFGPALKRAGYDYVIITGKSTKPVYIAVYDDEVLFHDAQELWGKGIFETTDTLMNGVDWKAPRVAAIGQAGENLSYMACIGVDKHRQYGRGGAGAVMGSKNLKALLVDGTHKISYYDDAKFNELNKKYSQEIVKNPGVIFRREKGTMKCVRSGQELGYLPTKNHQLIRFDDFEKISSEAAREELNWKNTSCYNCGIRCSKWATWDDHKIEGPEYETTAFLGSDNMINSIKDVSWANEMCNDLGLDTISTGITIAFAMECFEKGLVDNWNGMELNWGNAEAQRQMIEAIAHKKGVGEIFGNGTREAASIIGQDSEKFAINTFGMELSGINPKGSLSQGIIFAVADFASHTRLWMPETEMGPDFTIEDIPQAVADGLDTINARNSLVICDFVPLGLDKLSELLTAATGINHTENSLMEIGADITHLARRYNLRNGRTYKDDTIPERFFTENSLAGFMEGQPVDRSLFRQLVEAYYTIRNWNEMGEPALAD